MADKCSAQTIRGKPCSKLAVLEGKCLHHFRFVAKKKKKSGKVKIKAKAKNTAKYPLGCGFCKQKKICVYLRRKIVERCKKRKDNLRRYGYKEVD